MQNKIRKNINPENFLRNAKQEFPCQSLESFSGEYYNMENKILDFRFGPVNQFHNILRLLDVLPNFLFTTSETMGHYYLET